MPFCHDSLNLCVCVLCQQLALWMFCLTQQVKPRVREVFTCTNPNTQSMCTHTENSHSLSCENLDKLYVSLCTVSLSSADPSLCHLSTSFSSSFVLSSFHLPHLHPFCPLLLYLLLLCSSTCPCRVHLSDPVTLAAGRQIASTPTGLCITLLSPSVDQIALTVYQ